MPAIFVIMLRTLSYSEAVLGYLDVDFFECSLLSEEGYEKRIV